MSDPAQLQAKQWDRRIERARELAAEYPFARELLVFYSELTAFQKDVYLDVQSSGATAAGNDGVLPLELERLSLAFLMPRFPPFLSMLEREGPATGPKCLRAFSAETSRNRPAPPGSSGFAPRLSCNPLWSTSPDAQA